MTNIVSIDVGNKTGICMAIYNQETKKYDYTTHTFNHEKSLTIVDLKNVIDFKKFDILLIEYQNDSWKGSNNYTQRILQEKNYMWTNLALIQNNKIKVEQIRKTTITPILKQYVAFKFTKGVKRRPILKKASITAFNIIFDKWVTDDESDAYFFIKSYLKNGSKNNDKI